jgi:hypothetical protein
MLIDCRPSSALMVHRPPLDGRLVRKQLEGTVHQPGVVNMCNHVVEEVVLLVGVLGIRECAVRGLLLAWKWCEEQHVLVGNIAKVLRQC